MQQNVYVQICEMLVAKIHYQLNLNYVPMSNLKEI